MEDSGPDVGPLRLFLGSGIRNLVLKIAETNSKYEYRESPAEETLKTFLSSCLYHFKQLETVQLAFEKATPPPHNARGIEEDRRMLKVTDGQPVPFVYLIRHHMNWECGRESGPANHTEERLWGIEFGEPTSYATRWKWCAEEGKTLELVRGARLELEQKIGREETGIDHEIAG